MTDEPQITREQFIADYLAESRIDDAVIDGELVTYWGARQLALRCRCGEDGCRGWAMVPPSSRGWHMFQNALEGEGPTHDEAMAMDMAYRQPI